MYIVVQRYNQMEAKVSLKRITVKTKFGVRNEE